METAEKYFIEMRHLAEQFGYHLRQPYPESAPLVLEAEHARAGNWVEYEYLPHTFVINPEHYDVGDPTVVIENKKLFLLALSKAAIREALNMERNRRCCMIKNVLGL